MAAKPVKLKTKDKTTTLYPKTLITAVQDERGNTVDQITLLKDNTTEFTPTGDYQPATKKYVDENGGVKVILSSSQPVNPASGDFWYQEE